MQPYTAVTDPTSIERPTLRPSASKGHDFNGILKDLHNEMGNTTSLPYSASSPSPLNNARLKVGTEAVRAQLAAMESLLDKKNITQVKGRLFSFLVEQKFSQEDAHLLVYGVKRPAGPVMRVMNACAAGLNSFSDRLVEPPLRFVLKRLLYDTAVLIKTRVFTSKLVQLPPDRNAPPRPPAQQSPERRIAPPRPPKPPGTAEKFRRVSMPPQPAAPPAAPLAARTSMLDDRKENGAGPAPVVVAVPHVEQAAPSSRCGRITRTFLAGCSKCWNVVPEKARSWLVTEFIQDPIKEIARKATTGTILYVSGAIAYSVGGTIVSAAQVAGSAIAGVAVTAAQELTSRIRPS